MYLKNLLIITGSDLIQQKPYMPFRLFFGQFLQPYHKFVLVQTQGDGMTACFPGNAPASFLNQFANILQNQITEYNPVFFVDVFQILEKQIHHHALRLLSAGLGQKLHARTESVKTGDGVCHIFPELLRLTLLLLLNITDTSNQLPALSVRIADNLSRKSDPDKFRLPRPAHPEFRIGTVRIQCQRLKRRFPVRFVDIVRIDEIALGSRILPPSAHGFVIHQIQDMILQIIGKKDVFGGFKSHLIALLFLQKNVFGFFLLLCQISDYLIESVNFQNIGKPELLQTGASFHNTLHQALNRPGQMPDQNINAENAENKACKNGNQHPKIELAAHTKQLPFRIQAQQYPLGIFIRHISVIKPERAFHRIDSLSGQRYIPYKGKIIVSRFRQGKIPARRPDQIAEHSLTGQKQVTSILLFYSQHIAGLLRAVQLPGRKIVIEILTGDFHPQYAVHLSLIPQRNGICNHLIGIRILFFQGKGKGPVSQILRICLRIFHSGAPWLIEISILGILAHPFHVEQARPVGIQGNIPRSGELLAASFQKQIRIINGICVGIGIPDENPGIIPRRLQLGSRQNQKHSSSRIILQNAETFRKQPLQKTRLQLV